MHQIRIETDNNDGQVIYDSHNKKSYAYQIDIWKQNLGLLIYLLNYSSDIM